MANKKDTAKRSYGEGFSAADNIFGEAERTNNPNATRVGLDPGIRRVLEQNTGTTRRTMSGQLEDPLAPTGIDWLVDNAGRGQTNSWNQPRYPGVPGSSQAQTLGPRSGPESSVFDERGNRTMMTPYGGATNTLLPQNIPEGGSQRLPMGEGAALSATIAGLFGGGNSLPPQSANPMGPPVSAVDVFARNDDPVTAEARRLAMQEALARQTQRSQPVAPPGQPTAQASPIPSSPSYVADPYFGMVMPTNGGLTQWLGANAGILGADTGDLAYNQAIVPILEILFGGQYAPSTMGSSFRNWLTQ